MVALLKLLVQYNLVEGLTGLENAQAAETREITPVRPVRPRATRRSPARCTRRIARRPAEPLRYPFEAPERHRLHPMQRRVPDPSSWRPARRRIRL